MFKLEIETGNDAFHDDPGAEIARILRKLADGLSYGGEYSPYERITLRDVNGNTVGEAIGRS